MVVWFKQSLKKLNDKKNQAETQKAEIAELQDALIEIADIVSGAYAATNSDNNEGGVENG